MKPLLQVINLWLSANPLNVVPVSVMTPQELRAQGEMAPWLQKKIKTLLRISTSKISKGFLDLALRPPRVLTESSFSVGRSAKRLVQFAAESKSEIIVLGTHGRKGWSRLENGSFTEAVIAQASIPVLSVHPRMEVSEQISTILFPTDFSKASKKAFPRVCEMARRFDARIILFHVDSFPIETFSGIAMPTLNDAAWQAHREGTKMQGEQWCRQAETLGAYCSFEMTTQGEGTGLAILKELQGSKADMIVLAISRGTAIPPFFRIILRDILTGSSKPILTMGI
jgi:nucleotide-binding universal stress UspA family protein